MPDKLHVIMDRLKLIWKFDERKCVRMLAKLDQLEASGGTQEMRSMKKLLELVLEAKQRIRRGERCG
jgi:hypothetical protein